MIAHSKNYPQAVSEAAWHGLTQLKEDSSPEGRMTAMAYVLGYIAALDEVPQEVADFARSALGQESQ